MLSELQGVKKIGYFSVNLFDHLVLKDKEVIHRRWGFTYQPGDIWWYWFRRRGAEHSHQGNQADLKTGRVEKGWNKSASAVCVEETYKNKTQIWTCRHKEEKVRKITVYHNCRLLIVSCILAFLQNHLPDVLGLFAECC